MKRTFLFIFVMAFASRTSALNQAELQRITFDQHIGQPISRDLTFRDSRGQTVRLGDYFGNKPLLLVLGYYHCPMLCTLINDGMIESLQELRLNVGKDFNIVSVSIDPNETPQLAAAKKVQYLKRYGRPAADDGWHFLVGDRNSIVQLTNEAGFRFAYAPESGEYAHPSGFIVLTPEGKISRYLFGVNFDARELLTAITAAANRQQGSAVQRLALLCFHYNPITGKYGALIMTSLRVSSVATVCGIIALILYLGGRNRRTRRALVAESMESNEPVSRPL